MEKYKKMYAKYIIECKCEPRPGAFAKSRLALSNEEQSSFSAVWVHYMANAKIREVPKFSRLFMKPKGLENNRESCGGIKGFSTTFPKSGGENYGRETVRSFRIQLRKFLVIFISVFFIIFSSGDDDFRYCGSCKKNPVHCVRAQTWLKAFLRP